MKDKPEMLFLRPDISSLDKNDEDKPIDDFINKLNDYNFFNLQSLIENHIEFIHGIKLNCNAPIELKQALTGTLNSYC